MGRITGYYGPPDSFNPPEDECEEYDYEYDNYDEHRDYQEFLREEREASDGANDD